MYLILKTLHLLMIISWFAVLFYLPRIFVNLAMVEDKESSEYQRLCVMARKLYKFMTPIGIVAVIAGLWTWYVAYSMADIWLHIKTTATLILLVFNFHCGIILKNFQEKTNQRGHVWFRFYNEIPTILMLICVYLAVVKATDLSWLAM